MSTSGGYTTYKADVIERGRGKGVFLKDAQSWPKASRFYWFLPVLPFLLVVTNDIHAANGKTGLISVCVCYL